MFSDNKITQLFGIQYPIIQAGMIWCSGWRLASAVSNAGGFGLIGSGSMYPDVFKQHVQKCKAATDKPFGVNLPLLYPAVDEHIQTIIDEKVPVVFSSAGNPKKWTKKLQDAGVKVVHVVPGAKYAVKAQEAGVDAVVCEGFEAGGHNGREETTTFCLIPMVRREIELPLLAAGGIATGGGMLAAMALGADGVQVGSRFAATFESSAHDHFKQAIANAKEGDTMLSMKQLVPVRLLRNKFYNEIKQMEDAAAPLDKIVEHLGRARAKKGMFEGDMEEGELEIGQISALIDSIESAADVVNNMVSEYTALTAAIKNGTGKW